MKIKKIIDLCKKSKRIILFTDEERGEQWISNGEAAYPLFDCPRFDEDTIFAVFDIPQKKAEEIRFEEKAVFPSAYDFSDTTENEMPADRWALGLVVNGERVIPFSTSQGLVFVGEKYLAPFSDYDMAQLTFSERIDTAGQSYFAVKAGFLLIGIVMPIRIINEDLVRDLGRLHRGCEVALANEKGATR